jgi:hypothetical protein
MDVLLATGAYSMLNAKSRHESTLETELRVMMEEAREQDAMIEKVGLAKRVRDAIAAMFGTASSRGFTEPAFER